MNQLKSQINQLIESPELQKNLIDLVYDISSVITDISTDKDKLTVNKRLYNWVLGVGVPITICDYHVDYYTHTQTYEIIVMVDYKVTSGYKPYQDLDNGITFSVMIDKQFLRNLKLDQLV